MYSIQSLGYNLYMLNEKTIIREVSPTEGASDETKGDKPLTFKDAMGLNRKQRRLLGKLNGIKIPGSTKSYVRPKANVY